MKLFPRPALASARAAAAGCIVWAALAAHAADGPMDFLFTSGKVPAADNSRTSPRVVKFGEFSAIRLAAREPGAAPNAHPAQVNVEPLRSALAAIQYTTPAGRVVPLFAGAELTELAPALAKALGAAGADDDLLLFSTARREDGYLSTPYSLAARLFVQEGALQLIVHDARADLYSGFRATNVAPSLTFGSRSAGSAVSIRSASAVSRRGDWVALGFGGAAAAPAGVAAAPPPAAIGKVAAPPEPAPAPASRARDPAFFDEQAQRLRGLKQLRDQNLISEEEYEQKRREIIKSL